MTQLPGRTDRVGVRDVVATTLRGDRDDPTTLYSFLGGGSLLADDTDYLNLGYWRERPTSYREAGDALAAELARFAGIDPPLPRGEGQGVRASSEHLSAVDVGFGFGEQDVLWAERFGLTIVGLNLTPPQIARAAERVRREGLADRVRYARASATAMPVAAESVDRVLALESAFHFRLRSDFFREAFRVLKPGGVLATADIVALGDLFAGVSPGALLRRLLVGIGRRFWHIPAENLYDEDRYRAELAAAGFEDVEVRSIGADTFPGIHAIMNAPETLARFPAHERPIVRLAGLSFLIAYRAGWMDYLLVRAVKPDRAGRSRTARERVNGSPSAPPPAAS